MEISTSRSQQHIPTFLDIKKSICVSNHFFFFLQSLPYFSLASTSQWFAVVYWIHELLQPHVLCTGKCTCSSCYQNGFCLWHGLECKTLPVALSMLTVNSSFSSSSSTRLSYFFLTEINPPLQNFSSQQTSSHASILTPTTFYPALLCLSAPNLTSQYYIAFTLQAVTRISKANTKTHNHSSKCIAPTFTEVYWHCNNNINSLVQLCPREQDFSHPLDRRVYICGTLKMSSDHTVSYTPSHWSVPAWFFDDCESKALLLPGPETHKVCSREFFSNGNIYTYIHKSVQAQLNKFALHATNVKSALNASSSV